MTQFSCLRKQNQKYRNLYFYRSVMLAQFACASITERVWQAEFSHPSSAERIGRRLGIVRQYAIMTSRKRNAILEEFILIYKSEPCIWRVKDKAYHDRNKRAAAYEKLLTKLRELETNATKEDVVKKINALRSNVRREKRKIDESTKSGASADEIYKPSLWYYDMFEFLGDQDTPRPSQSNIVDADEIEVRNIYFLYKCGVVGRMCVRVRACGNLKNVVLFFHIDNQLVIKKVNRCMVRSLGIVHLPLKI
ncbi:hypothetical protein ACJJTC_001480 [Scirpophaga incertulas]